MGKRKRLENTVINTGTKTKRRKLQNDDDGLEMDSEVDSSKMSRNFVGTNENKTTNYHNIKLKMGMNRYVGISYRELKRLNSFAFFRL